MRVTEGASVRALIGRWLLLIPADLRRENNVLKGHWILTGLLDRLENLAAVQFSRSVVSDSLQLHEL